MVARDAGRKVVGTLPGAVATGAGTLAAPHRARRRPGRGTSCERPASGRTLVCPPPRVDEPKPVLPVSLEFKKKFPG